MFLVLMVWGAGFGEVCGVFLGLVFPNNINYPLYGYTGMRLIKKSQQWMYKYRWERAMDEGGRG
jgi:hypothetical protein